MKNIQFLFLFLALSFSCASTTPIQQKDGTGENPTAIPSKTNVKYGPHERDLLDIYQASNAGKPSPVVVFIHGGGFIQGDKELKNNMAKFVQEFNKRGVTFVSINYPYISSVPLDEIFKNIGRSIQFLRANASTYNIQKEKIAVFGNSAGAGSSLWLNFHNDLKDPSSTDPVLRESSKPICAAAVSTQATYDLSQWGVILGEDQATINQKLSKKEMFPYFEKYMSTLTNEQKKNYTKEVDLLGLIDAKDKPVFLLNTEKPGKEPNMLHHPKHSEAVQSKCNQQGVKVTYFSPQDGKIAQGQKALLEFILGYLKN